MVLLAFFTGRTDAHSMHFKTVQIDVKMYDLIKI